MLVLHFCGENERQYYYMMHSINYMIIFFNWFIFESSPFWAGISSFIFYTPFYCSIFFKDLNLLETPIHSIIYICWTKIRYNIRAFDEFQSKIYQSLYIPKTSICQNTIIYICWTKIRYYIRAFDEFRYYIRAFDEFQSKNL